MCESRIYGEGRPPLFTLSLRRSAAFITAPHKQLHIWAGRDALRDQRGGQRPNARRVNERGPEGDVSLQAPVVLLLAFHNKDKFLGV